MGEDPSRARVTGPLRPYAAGFVAELARLGYAKGSACGQMFLMAHVSRWLAGEGLDASGLTPEAAGRFLAARRAAGYARLLSPTLLARLGLRAGEVAALSLDDIDWRAGEVTVTGKGRRSERLPLPPDVGAAVAAYLRGGRSEPFEGTRRVFLRLHAPHQGLTTGGVTMAVLAAAQRAGLGRVHAHRLRHTAATGMLRAGASLPEVGQVLRHRRLMSTAIYAKTDVPALRALARPWPGSVA